MQAVRISEVQVVPIKPVNGLVGFASCVVDERFYLGSIGIHKRLDGTGYRLTYPAKKVGSRQINYFHPVTKEAGQAIELAVYAKCNELFEGSDEQDGRHRKATDSYAKSAGA